MATSEERDAGKCRQYHLSLLQTVPHEPLLRCCFVDESLEVELWAGEMAQWLRVLTALPEVLSSIPSNHMVANNHL